MQFSYHFKFNVSDALIDRFKAIWLDVPISRKEFVRIVAKMEKKQHLNMRNSQTNPVKDEVEDRVRRSLDFTRVNSNDLMADNTMTNEIKRHAVIVSTKVKHWNSEIARVLKVTTSFLPKVRLELLNENNGDDLAATS
ncbi:hypothetical protein ACTXT7_001659 [Hymenolepis weldensis]